MTAPLLSIITVVRNDAAGLARTVASLAQTAADPAIECLLVDGASTDGTVAVARGFYPAERMVSEPDRGIYDAMNKGLRRARGRYGLWLNGGDTLVPGAAARLVAHLETATADVVGFGTVVSSPDGAFPSYTWHGSAVAFARGALPHPSTAIARDRALRLGGYDDRWPIAADRDLMLRLHRDGATYAAVDAAVAAFTTGGVSSTPRAWLEDIRLHRAHRLIGPWEAGVRYLKYLALRVPGVAPALHARSHRRAGYLSR